MKPEDLDPEEVKKAKALAAGPAGQETGKFPLRFARAVFFGEPSTPDDKTKLNNGTVTLLQLDRGRVGVTCSHVLEQYRQRHAEDPRVVLQIGECSFDPADHLVDEDPGLDLAVLDLSQFPRERLLCGNWLGSEFHQPVEWPPGDVVVDSYVSFGGYPGTRRREVATGEFEFTTFSVGTVPVRSVSPERITIQLEREFWVKYRDGSPDDDSLDFKALGGLSGAPAFIHRGLHFDLVGFVYEFSEEFDLVHVRPARLITADGTVSNSS